MKIGFGSIGKCYAADNARKLMQEFGVQAGIINAAGDLATWGNQINGNPWRIGVNNPLETGETIEILEFSGANAVTTSGNYEKYAEISDKRYAHVINPKTGYPSTELMNVKIIGENAEICNGFSTSIMVLGLAKGLKMIEKYPDYRYIIITSTGEIIKSAPL